MLIRTGDTVQVLAGKDRGKRGAILAVQPLAQKVVVEGVNIATRHLKARAGRTQTGIVQLPAAMPWSKVMLVCPSCDKAMRPMSKIAADGTKQRTCRKCGAVIPAVKR
jgi:large subunit ribosomal protein L24